MTLEKDGGFRYIRNLLTCQENFPGPFGKDAGTGGTFKRISLTVITSLYAQSLHPRFKSLWVNT